MDPANQQVEPRSLTATELQRQLADGVPLQLVDVREAAELELARLPHPVQHLPLSRSADWIEGIEDRLVPERPVVVLCHAGVRSWHFACWLMQARSYRQVWNLRGGIDAWSTEVDPGVARY